MSREEKKKELYKAFVCKSSVSAMFKSLPQ